MNAIGLNISAMQANLRDPIPQSIRVPGSVPPARRWSQELSALTGPQNLASVTVKPTSFMAAARRSIETGLAALLTAALSVPRAILPPRAQSHVDRLRCERRAMAPGARSEADLLDGIYDATLDRIGKKSVARWWRKIVLRAQGHYLLPDNQYGTHCLQIECVREWLGNHYVRADLKALATSEMLGNATDTGEIRARLAQAYAQHTFEEPALAQGPIDTVVSGLVAGALSALHPSQRIMLALVREDHRHGQQTNSAVLAALSRIEAAMALRLPATEPRQWSDAKSSAAA